MDNLTLRHKLPSGRSWTEELPPGTQQRSSGAYAYNAAQQVLNIKFAGTWTNIRDLIKYAVGFSVAVPIFDPNNGAAQGPYTLSRNMPARHPRLRGLRCTKILSLQGVGISKQPNAITEKGDAGAGHIGMPAYIYASLMFEAPRYAMLEDSEMASTGAHGERVRLPEYARFTEWDFEPNLETIARKGVIWYFSSNPPSGTQATFAGDRLLRQPKAILKWTWHNVAEDFVLLGKLAPVNYYRRLGAVNHLDFPQAAYRDQNKAAGNVVQFRAGTCLLRAPTIKHSAQNHPAVLNGQLRSDLVPRCVDVEGSAYLFDPPSADGATIDLTAIGGWAATPIRGHNLAPTIAPVGGNTWFAAQNTLPGGAITQNMLLYPYCDFEQLWAAVESL